MRISGEIEPLEVGVLRRPEGWPAWLRVRCIHHDVRGLLSRLQGQFDRIVVEVPGVAQAGRRRSQYGISGPYAAAVGAVLAEAWRVGCPVITVASDHWTRQGGGKGQKKGDRLKLLELSSSYSQDGDKGGDAGDAISLGAWYAWHHGSEGVNSCLLHIPTAKLSAGRPYGVDTTGVDPNGAPMPVGSRWGSP